MPQPEVRMMQISGRKGGEPGKMTREAAAVPQIRGREAGESAAIVRLEALMAA